MAEQDQALLDPALQAEDEYRSSLGGIYPSQGRVNTNTNNNNNNNIDARDGRLEEEDQSPDQHGPRSHPPPSRQEPGKKKKRTSSTVGGDEEGRKKSRQSRELDQNASMTWLLTCRIM